MNLSIHQARVPFYLGYVNLAFRSNESSSQISAAFTQSLVRVNCTLNALTLMAKTNTMFITQRHPCIPNGNELNVMVSIAVPCLSRNNLCEAAMQKDQAKSKDLLELFVIQENQGIQQIAISSVEQKLCTG